MRTTPLHFTTSEIFAEVDAVGRVCLEWLGAGRVVLEDPPQRPCYHGSGLQEQVLPETKAEAAPLGVSGMSKNL